MPTNRHTTRRRPAAASLLATVTLLLVAAAAPSTVLPTSRDGADLAVEPAVLRAEDGRAEVDVHLGTDATEDVVVDLRLATPTVATDGTVTIGDDVPPGDVTAGARLRPGERLRATVTGLTGPALVVATATAVDGTAAAAPTSALVLPGAPGPAPIVAITERDGEVDATISSTSPLLVAVRVRGDTTTTYPDRLVVPDAPVVLTADAAAWPLPSEVVVTDETGRTVTATTSATTIVVLAVALLVAAGGALLVVRRRHAVTDA